LSIFQWRFRKKSEYINQRYPKSEMITNVTIFINRALSFAFFYCSGDKSISCRLCYTFYRWDIRTPTSLTIRLLQVIFFISLSLILRSDQKFLTSTFLQIVWIFFESNWVDPVCHWRFRNQRINAPFANSNLEVKEEITL